MSDFAPFPMLEDEVRAVMAVPDPAPEFVNSLRTRLVLQADRRVAARPRPQLRLAWSLSLVVVAGLLVAVLVIGPGRVLAAVRGVLGYVPGLGVVQNDGNLRVLTEPVQVVRDGITLSVEQGAADAQRTVLLYSVQGLLSQAASAQGGAPDAGGPVSLQLADGRSLRLLQHTSGYGQDWGADYQDRLVFPALPPGTSDLTLLIARLNNMPPGAAPEDWRIPLRFRPAPPGTPMLPVYMMEPPLPGPTTAAGGPGPLNADEQQGIQFRLLQAVELPDGYLLQGSLTWQRGDEATALLADSWPVLHDANGQPIPASPVTPEVIATPVGRPASYWALRVEGKNYPMPWVLTLAAAQLQVATDLRFQVDLGAAPQPGQMWQVDQELVIAGRRLHVDAARLSAGEDGRTWLEIDFAAGSGLAAIGLWDDGASSGGLTSRSTSTGSGEVLASIGYRDTPTGLRRLRVGNASFAVQGPWELTWLPPGAGKH